MEHPCTGGYQSDVRDFEQDQRKSAFLILKGYRKLWKGWQLSQVESGNKSFKEGVSISTLRNRKATEQGVRNRAQSLGAEKGWVKGRGEGEEITLKMAGADRPSVCRTSGLPLPAAEPLSQPLLSRPRVGSHLADCHQE